MLATVAVNAVAPALAQAAPGVDKGAVCADCHDAEGKQYASSVHSAAGINCRDCHGGALAYPVELATIEKLRRVAGSLSAAATRPASIEKFDHGGDFKGKPTRREVPERCGTCHSDVAIMNPYGLPTDQLAQYRASGHGRALYLNANDRVAVCIDCHGTHAILAPKDPSSSVFPKNIPATCGRCHADVSVMRGTNLSTHVVEQYRESVHGRALLEKSDLGMPHCATCHGSHSAIPPGFRDVGHVCGRCHQQEEQNFLQSFHAKFPFFPRCVACHTGSPEQRDHRIVRLAVSPDGARKAYRAAVQTLGGQSAEAALAEAYAARREPAVPSFEAFCQRCHTAGRQTAHRAFFGELDQQASQVGETLYQIVRGAEIRYASTADRVQRVGQGVLLVTDESLLLEEARTKLINIGALQHTLDLEKVKTAAGELDGLSAQIEQSLREKERSLRWRFWGLLPLWVFLTLFVGVLWMKYKRLKAEMVVPLESTTDGVEGSL